MNKQSQQINKQTETQKENTTHNSKTKNITNFSGLQSENEVDPRNRRADFKQFCSPLKFYLENSLLHCKHQHTFVPCFCLLFSFYLLLSMPGLFQFNKSNMLEVRKYIKIGQVCRFVSCHRLSYYSLLNLLCTTHFLTTDIKQQKILGINPESYLSVTQ